MSIISENQAPTGLEELERQHLKDRAHIQALTEVLEKLSKENTMLNARVKYNTEVAMRRLGQAVSEIETLHEKIEFMVDSWQADVREFLIDREKERDSRLALIEPFRPIRMGAAEIKGPDGTP